MSDEAEIQEIIESSIVEGLLEAAKQRMAEAALCIGGPQREQIYDARDLRAAVINARICLHSVEPIIAELERREQQMEEDA